MSELLPCPFCGGEAEMLTAESMNGGYLFGIMCNDCCSRGDVYDTEAEAIEAWNTRYEPMMDAIPMTEENMRKYGWVKERTCRVEIDEYGCYPCSSCGVDIPSRFVGSIDYCPWCGAKVVSE